MFCSNCGTQLADGAKFCHNCGARTEVNAVLPKPGAQQAIPVTPIQQPAPSPANAAPSSPMPPAQPSVQTAASAPAADTPVSRTTVDGPVQQYTAEAQAPAPTVQNPYVQAAGTYTQQAVPAVAPAKVKKKKKTGWIFLALLIVVALMAAGYYFFFGDGSPAGRASRYLEKAMQADADGDIVTAVELYEDAYEADPENEEILNGLSACRIQLFYDYSLVRDYEKAEEQFKRLNELVPSDYINSLGEGLYTEWIERIIRGTCDDDGYSVLKRAKDLLPDDMRILYTYFFLDPEDPSNLAERIADISDSGDEIYNCLLVHMYTDLIATKAGRSAGSEYRVNIRDHDYGCVIFRKMEDDEGYFAYYGDVDGDGQRSGEGLLFCYKTDKESGDDYLYYYISEWEDDLPNGYFIELLMRGDGFNEMEHYKGELVNGYYDGVLTTTFSDGMQYMSVYDEGNIIPFGTDDDGNYITGIATDDSGRYYTTSPDVPLGQYGLDEY